MHIHNKKRYQFALSSFVRMHGHSIIHNHNVKQFCIEWSNSDSVFPLEGLNEFDQYLYYEYKNWRGA